MNDTANPYSAPSAGPTARADIPRLRGILGFLLWFGLAGGVWFGRTQMAPIYQDFEVPLPNVTRFFIYPLSPFLLVITGSGFLGAMTLMRNPKYRSTLQTISVVAAIALAVVAVYGFFRPLVVLIQSLD